MVKRIELLVPPVALALAIACGGSGGAAGNGSDGGSTGDGTSGTGHSGTGGKAPPGAGTGGGSSAGTNAQAGDDTGAGGTSGGTSDTIDDLTVPPGHIAVGHQHACVVTAATGVECWGFGLQNYDAPKGTGFARVAAGNDGDCALDPDGNATCWGDLPEPPAESFSHLVVGESACGVTKPDGKLLCWPALDTLLPSAPLNAQGGFVRVALGAAFLCAVTDAQALQCWSADGDYTSADTPSGTFLDVNAAASDVCAQTPTGVAHCWGADTAHQDRSASSSAYRQVVAGKDSVCVLKADRRLQCWGSDLAATAAPTGDEFVEIAIGDQLGCGIQQTGDVTCWGIDPLPGKMQPAGLKALVP